jgi:hypothetical protein
LFLSRLSGYRLCLTGTQESFDYGSEANTWHANVFAPEDVLPGFRASQDKFFRDMWAVTKELLRALAIGIGIPYEQQDFFIKHHSGDNNLARLAYYPPISSQILEMTKSPRLPPHVDFSSITLLLQDGEQGGLEVEDRMNGWNLAPIAPLRNAILISVGDVLQRWTNSKSTLIFIPATTELAQIGSGLVITMSPFHHQVQNTRHFPLMGATASFPGAIQSHTLSIRTPNRR